MTFRAVALSSKPISNQVCLSIFSRHLTPGWSDAVKVMWFAERHSGLDRTSDPKSNTNNLFNPLRPNNDVSQTSHCNIKGV